MLDFSDAAGAIRLSLHLPSLAERVAARIEELILDGQIRPGARIIEESLSRDLGISRASLREALFALESAGLIAREGRGGRVIRTLTHEDIVELYELWTILETEGAVMACQSSSPADHARIAGIITSMDTAADRTAYHRLNLEFHRAMMAPCRNRRLVEAYDFCLKQVRWAWALAIAKAGDPAASQREHRAIAEAYVARDADRLRPLVHDHLSAGAVRAGGF
jgi:DNA-binding GntR family transcriptional regulator